MLPRQDSTAGVCPRTGLTHATRQHGQKLGMSAGAWGQAPGEVRAPGRPQKQNPRAVRLRGLSNKSLTMTYFHRCTSTIIGAKAFHCPVRDGKEWDHLAMVVRRNRLSG